jgi:uncharacterized protein YfaS (alpha-2-macroglobulin family)
MLAHGEDPNHGPYAKSIRAGVTFIMRSADNRTGYLGTSMYNHGFAALALAEAYGSVNIEGIGPALQKAVELILSTQARNRYGAWRYSPQSTDADTTVSGAQMVALLAARNAGLAVPEEAVRKGLGFFKQCQSGDGGIGYTSAGGSSPARTAIGTLVFALAKMQDSVHFKAAFRYLRESAFRSSGYDFYYRYYASQAVFQASEKEWEKWNAQNIKTLLASQNPDGSWRGSHGVTFSTASALLSLAVNYRFLPIYER